MNNDSTANITTYIMRIPIFTLKGPNPPRKCFIYGWTHIELVKGTLTVKPLLKPDIVLQTGDTVEITGFIGRGESVPGKTWRDPEFSSLSGRRRNAIVNLY